MVNPLIARPQNHVGNALGWIADQNLAQQRNALVADRTAQDARQFDVIRQDQQNALAAQTEEQQEAERAAMLAPLLAQGDPQAYAAFLQEADDPRLTAMFGDKAPEEAGPLLAQVMANQYGFQLPPKPPGPIQMQSFPGMGQALIQDGEIQQFRAAPQPQQYTPTAEERNWALRQRLPPDQRAEFDRLYGKGTDAPAVNIQQTERRAGDAENVRAAIAEAKALIGPLSAGFVGQKTREQGGTPAFNLNAKIDTIKANIGFDRLQRMRDESKTGGALGQVAVQELTMLQSTITSLDTAQSPKQLAAALDRVDAQYAKAMAAYDAAMQEKGGVAGQTAPPSAPKRIRFDANGNQIP